MKTKHHFFKTPTMKAAVIMGGILIFLSIAGFVLRLPPQPGKPPADFGISTIYLLSGIAGIFAGICGTQTARGFFRMSVIGFGMLAFMALGYPDVPIMGWLTNDFTHWVVHATIAIVSFYWGFAPASKTHHSHAVHKKHPHETKIERELVQHH